MTKALFKRQMMEVFSWLYQEKKTGKHRSAKGVVGTAVLYLLLFGFLGVIFGGAANALCKSLLSANMGWMYWCIMGLLAVFLGVFGSVFNTYSSLYQAKDNDLLLAMPIPASQILLARLSGVYAMGLMYELIVMLPTLLIWFMNAPFSIMGTVHVLLIPLVLSVLILVLSAILGWVVALVATKVKHKKIITVVISLVFIGAYYSVCGMAYSIFQMILLNLEAFGEKLRIFLYPLYYMGMAAEGNVLSMLIFTGIVLAAGVTTYLVLSHSFLKLATTNHGEAKTVYKEQTVKTGSVGGALLQKELRRFAGSTNYMLNCGLGIVLMPFSAVALVLKSDSVRDFFSIPGLESCLPLLVVAIVCLFATMNIMTAPSISLEGKNLWIVQSMPVSGSQVLRAKLYLYLLLTFLPAIPLVAVLEWLTKPGLVYGILIPVVSALFALLMAEIGLALNLKMPNLNWTSEIIPIKQSVPVAVTLFGGWLMVIALAGIYVLLRNVVSISTYFVLVCAAFFMAAGWLHHWLMTRGAKIFEVL